MSPITKTFVVIHVILSMLLTAGVVVFVNRVDDYKKIVADEKAGRALARQAAETAGAAEASAKEALNRVQGQLAEQATAAKKERDDAALALLDLNTKLADATKQLAITQADNARAVAGMTASQSAQTQLQAMVTDIRTKVDELQKQKLELDTAVADLTSKNDTLERQRRDLAERVSSIEGQLDNASKLLTANNIKVGSPVPADIGNPPINGVVREVRVIEQVPYATISVGSADAVTKGMKFRVIDRQSGEFLGLLTVEAVESNESSGRLYGPNVSRVKGGNGGSEVRTQL